EEHPVLHVDETREHQLREEPRAVLDLLEQAEEDAVRRGHVLVLDEGEPLVEALLEGAFEVDRIAGVLPEDLGTRRGLVRVDLLAAATVVAGGAAAQLVPDVEAGGDVPDGLRDRQVLEFRANQAGKAEAGAGAEEAMVVVDEAQDAVVDALV